MKIILSRFFAATVFTAALVLGPVQAAVKVGEAAPNFTLADITGQRHSLAELKGKTVVLEWVNQECPFVVKHYASGNMPALQKSATADGVVWLLVNSGKPGAQGDFAPAKVGEWATRHNAAFTAYFRDQDGKVGKAYGAKTTPQMFVINKDGVLVYNGAIDSIRSTDRNDVPKAKNYVTEALAALKAGKPVEVGNTKPYGCSVKY